MSLLERISGLLSIYKRGQGVWSRGLAALVLLAMGTYGAVQTGRWLVGARHLGTIKIGGLAIPVYYGLGIYLPVIIFLVFAGLTVYICNTRRPADILIETEIEMRKVTWPTSREVVGATAVVIVVVLILGFYLWFLDWAFMSTLLKWLGAAPST